MNNIRYKIEKLRFKLIIDRISLLISFGLLKGLQRIFCRLRMIDMTKRLFVLELEQGKEVAIPRLLSLKDLPYSCRFYDSLIHIVQTKTSNEKKNILAL